MNESSRKLLFFLGAILALSPLKGQVLAKQRPSLNLEKMEATKKAFGGDAKLLGRYAEIYGLFCPLNTDVDEELKGLGLASEDRLLLLTQCMALKNKYPTMKRNLDDETFKVGLKKTLSPAHLAILEDPGTNRKIYSAGIGPIWADTEDVGLRLGNARLGMTMSFNENSPELEAHWVHPQTLLRVPIDKHQMVGSTDLAEAFLKLEILSPAKPKKQEGGLGGFFSKAMKAIDVSDMALITEFPVPQLYLKQGTEFSVRFRSTQALPGLAVFLIPLQDKSETDTTPAFTWYFGKKEHPPKTTLFQKPYQTRSYQEPRLAGMYGVIANYPNGVPAGNYLVILTSPQRPDDAKQAFMLNVYEDKPASGVSMPAWW